MSSNTDRAEDLIQSILSSVQRIQKCVNREVGEHNPALKEAINELRFVDDKMCEVAEMLEGE